MQVRRALDADFGPPSFGPPLLLISLLAMGDRAESKRREVAAKSGAKIGGLLSRCGSSDTVLPPTELFNEGWMLRLVLEWAQRHPDAIPALRFAPGSRWFSEALLPSRFKPRRRGDSAGEGFTHADAVIGHFTVGSSGRGDIKLNSDARQLTVVEAKMASGLAPGTFRAPTFNQAARNVACIANLVRLADLERSAIDLSFVVLAPQARLEAFAPVLERSAICEAVRARASAFDLDASEWCENSFMPIAAACSIRPVAWEDVLLGIAGGRS